MPNHLGILANGTALDVNHCVFYGVTDAVVMWNRKSENSQLHHNLFLNMYGAAVWTWSTTKDFKFYNLTAIKRPTTLGLLDCATASVLGKLTLRD